jgi:hypothetical protein
LSKAPTPLLLLLSLLCKVGEVLAIHDRYKEFCGPAARELWECS